MSITARLKKIECELKPKEMPDEKKLCRLLDDAFMEYGSIPHCKTKALDELQRIYHDNEPKLWSTRQVAELLKLKTPFYGMTREKVVAVFKQMDDAV